MNGLLLHLGAVHNYWCFKILISFPKTNVGTHFITPRLSCSPGCDLPTFIQGEKNTRPKSHLGHPPNGISLWGRPHACFFLVAHFLHYFVHVCTCTCTYILLRFNIARWYAGQSNFAFLFLFINFVYEKWISIFNYLPQPTHPLIWKKKHRQLWMPLVFHFVMYSRVTNTCPYPWR